MSERHYHHPMNYKIAAEACKLGCKIIYLCAWQSGNKLNIKCAFRMGTGRQKEKSFQYNYPVSFFQEDDRAAQEIAKEIVK